MNAQLVELNRIGNLSLFWYACPVCGEESRLSGDETNYANNGAIGIWTPPCGHSVRVPNVF